MAIIAVRISGRRAAVLEEEVRVSIHHVGVGQSSILLAVVASQKSLECSLLREPIPTTKPIGHMISVSPGGWDWLLGGALHGYGGRRTQAVFTQRCNLHGWSFVRVLLRRGFFIGATHRRRQVM